MHRAHVFPAGARNGGRKAASVLLDFCDRCADAITLRLHPRGAAPKNHRCYCGAPGRILVRVYQPTVAMKGANYAYTGHLCARHGRVLAAVAEAEPRGDRRAAHNRVAV